jgi:hypothetical protein
VNKDVFSSFFVSFFQTDSRPRHTGIVTNIAFHSVVDHIQQIMSSSSSFKAIMGRALRETGSALKEAGNAEVRRLS